MCTVEGIFLSGTGKAITCQVDVVISCFWQIFAPVLNLHAHLELGQCGLLLQCGSQISSVMYANNMKYNF